ncbi:alpha/beta fold hydrolase [Lentzea jiangxiensis]|uniref:Pimeloyl-ACP methyl ester carboxylesterase n=1 Tax=Lentzea jiangxiensis TaxID=641025 RepID=A0A1H0K274_9PSEU|nr:alpha/beta hydrolase [Lentzea jiangxiensis]SDO50128.1 Pimeloyl-ACP methyl ester carboxylesterase [Lentzea jiangxiensis]
MSAISPAGATIPDVTHHVAAVNGTRLHYVSAGTDGSPVLLVHGWPETWWAFRKLIPLLARSHRVFAVDLRGFGDSDTTGSGVDAATYVEDLHQLIEHLEVGPVHLSCQDISGNTGFRLAATHPADVLTLTAVETALIGFGLENLADVNNGGSWHVGFLGAPGIPELFLPGVERRMIADWAYPMMTATEGAVTEADLDEFIRTYARTDGWSGTAALYREIFADKGTTKALAASSPLPVPVLTVDAASGSFTEQTFRSVATSEITSLRLRDVGHLVAQEAPDELAAAMVKFMARAELPAVAPN